MTPLETLGYILGTSFASGLNLYATVAAAGLLERFGLVHLPPQLHVLSNPLVLGIAATLFLIEFVADKVPYVDSVWDAVHTFIRPPAAAFLSYTAFSGNVPEEWRIGAVFLAWLAAAHPMVTAAVVVVLLVVAVLLIRRFYGLVRRLVTQAGGRSSG